MKVLIVDDEFYFRKALIETTNWGALGLNVLGEAENGIDALKIIEEKNPDIVLADINMPKMNGLQFAKKAKEYCKDIKIIFISGYDMFEYAREAIRLGADGYLLKPVKELELMEELTRVVKVCYKERMMREEFQTEKQKSRDIQKTFFLSKVLLTDSEEERNTFLDKVLDADPSFLQKCSGFFVVVGISDNYEIMNTEDFHLWNFTGMNYFEERLKQECQITVLSEVDDKVVFFVPVTYKEAQREIIEILEEGQRILRNYFGFSMLFGISTIYENVKSIQNAYREALKALENRIFEDEINLAVIGEDTQCNENYVLSGNEKKRLFFYLKERDVENVQKILEQIFEEAKEQKVSWGRLRILCIELLTPCIDMLTGTEEMYNKVMNQEKINIFEEVQEKRNFKELKEYVKQVYNILCTVTKTQEILPENVQKILRIVEERYADSELNVNSIAKEMYMNYNYLCVVFKKALNITINDYIFKFRMQKAIEYFNNSNMQVGEVAEKTGYSNIGYFSRCFRKEFGITPSKYIESLR